MIDVVIFGAGFHGRAAYRKLKKIEDYSVLCFLDNDKAAQCSSFDGISILSPEKIKEFKFDKVVLIGRDVKEQSSQLTIDLQIDYSKLWFIDKGFTKPSTEELEKREDESVSLLATFIEYAKKSNVNYWMDYGSLLTLKRKKPIGSCSDIDITIISQTDAKKLLDEMQSSKVFEKYDLQISLCNDVNQLFSIGDIKAFTISSKPNYIEEPVIIDVHIYFSHGDNFYMNSDLGYFHYSPKLHFSEFSCFSYKNLSLRLPIYLDKYLAHIYGPSWRVPDKNWTNASYKNITKNLI